MSEDRKDAEQLLEERVASIASLAYDERWLDFKAVLERQIEDLLIEEDEMFEMKEIFSHKGARAQIKQIIEMPTEAAKAVAEDKT